jgi:hypothetical protein
MKCSQCATEIPAIATTCPQCGSQRTATTDPMSEYPASTFSYRPPGTPPWPTSVPQSTSQLVMMTPVPSGQTVQAQRPRARKRRPTTGSILSSVAVLVLAPIIGAAIVFGMLYSQGYFAAQTHTSTNASSKQPASTPATNSSSSNTNSPSGSLPAPTAFKTAKDTTVNVTLRYPSDWSINQPNKTQNSSALLLEQSKIGIDLIVRHFTSSFSSSIPSAQQLNQAYIQSLSQYAGIQNIQVVKSDNAAPNIGGDQWQQSEATFTDGQGTKQHFITIAVQHSKSYYGINIFVPDSLYKDASSKYFTPIFQSLKFLS